MRIWRFSRRLSKRLFVGIALAGIALSANVSRAQDQSLWLPDPLDTRTYREYWPGSCVAAVLRQQTFEEGRRRLIVDTTRFDIAADTLTTEAVEVGQTCLAAIASQPRESREVVAWGQLHLLIGDERRANAIFAKQIADDAQRVAQHSTAQQAGTLLQILRAYLSALPARIEQAEMISRRLDSLSGDTAAVFRLEAYSALLGAYARHLDNDAMRRTAERIVAVGPQLSKAARSELGGLLLSGYVMLAQLIAEDAGESQLAKGIMQLAREELKDIDVIVPILAQRDSMMSFYGAKAARVIAPHWFSDDPTDSLRPRPGHPALIVLAMKREMVPAVRRIVQEVPGLDAVWLKGTSGYFRFSGVLDSKSEIEAIRKYFVDDLKIPGTLAITETRFVQLPDKRRIAVPSRHDRVYGARVGVSILLVDTQGIIRRVYTQWEPWTELRILAALRALSVRDVSENFAR